MTENEIARNKLCNILQTNADLPIMADVDSEIVTEDGCGWWLGEVKDACEGIEAQLLPFCRLSEAMRKEGGKP